MFMHITLAAIFGVIWLVKSPEPIGPASPPQPEYRFEQTLPPTCVVKDIIRHSALDYSVECEKGEW